MSACSGPKDIHQCAEAVLAHLNLSSGAPDVRLLANLDRLFAHLAGREDADLVPDTRSPGDTTCSKLHRLLRDELGRLRDTSSTFTRTEQVEAVLPLCFEHLLPAYRRWHADLLAHQSERRLFRPMFIGRAMEAILRQEPPWEETNRIVRGALGQLNDYLGYRPVAVLETEQKIQPYPHEWVAPIPLYVRGAGVATGPYAELIAEAIRMIEQAPASILFRAYFELEHFDELALDPRAYDFDHPVNKRPNYLYGQWDLGQLDTKGYARRFIVHETSLAAILDRVGQAPAEHRREYLIEAAAVLAGTMLMGSGVSGNRPGAHSSDATLGTLVGSIAGYRDEFYESMIEHVPPDHAARLRDEARQVHQPFGVARQHYNQYIAQSRVEQLQNVHLALVKARMGYLDEAERQARNVAAASARFQTDIHCRLHEASGLIDRGELDRALAMAVEAEGLIHRGIECGALIDPWNILGFGARFSLFPALENSVHDFRADDLISPLGALFDVLVRIRRSAAGGGNRTLDDAVADRMDQLAAWWDRFATTEVPEVDGFSGRETCESAKHVATALRAWHEGGTAAGDIAFWRGHVEQFTTAKAYAMVIEALLEQGDPLAAMALLVQWLSQSDETWLYGDGYSFHELAVHWMEAVLPARAKWPEQPIDPIDMPNDQRWPLARKFLDYIEANAEEYWEVPQFELGDEFPAGDIAAGDELLDELEGEFDEEDEDEDEDEDGGLFSAAYENVVFRGTTEDGTEGDLFDGSMDPTDSELAYEGERLGDRLVWLGTIARLWKLAAVFPVPPESADDRREASLRQWLARAVHNRQALLRLMHAVHHYELATPRSTHQSLSEYEHRLSMKESLLEQVVLACLEMIDAERVLRVALPKPPPSEQEGGWQAPAETVLRAVLAGDHETVDRHWPELLKHLARQPLLFQAVSRGGDPRAVIASRSIQVVLRRLLRLLPRLGMLGRTAELLATAQRMEVEHPIGPGAITEFDHSFETAFRSIVRCIVGSANHWHLEGMPREDGPLVALLERLTDRLLQYWLTYSRGLRISPIEALMTEDRWEAIKTFIIRYGDGLFTQHFLMNAGNLRAILHEGVDTYLDALAEEPNAEEDIRLLADLASGHIKRKPTAKMLETVIECILEHYPEYVDYNNTTTQSDKGENLYSLLDFLRLLVSYERVELNLRPVMIVHDELVRGGRTSAAEAWQEAVAAQVRDVADQHVAFYNRMVQQYGMRLRSIGQRIEERFIQPLAIDRMRALVRPAVEAKRRGEDRNPFFEQLEQQVAPFAENLSGAGVEVPEWLDALEAELDQVDAGLESDDLLEPHLAIPPRHLDWETTVNEVDGMG